MSITDDGRRAERAARVAFSHLAGVGPARLRWLMQARTAEATLTAFRAGTLDLDRADAPRGVTAERLATWQAAARSIDADALLSAHQQAGIDVLIPGDTHWPFDADPEPPLVLYVWGDSSVLVGQPRVSIVGTRRCTDAGRSIANELGTDLASAGVSVVSGLALGIDGAAHAGAVSARTRGQAHRVGRPIAVVANGLDRVSPRFHRSLTEAVALHGAVVSEAPLGVKGDRWRFPARNRLIAGLSEIVVVVESHDRGGALITVDEAIERGVPVMAVPGSIRSQASVGTNRLLADGAAPLCSAGDVLEALGIDPCEPAQASLFDSEPGSNRGDPTQASPLQQLILAESAAAPQPIDSLVRLSGATLDAVMIEVQRLVSSGMVTQVGSTVSATSR